MILAFAERVSEVSGKPIYETLLKYTNLYKVFAIDDWKFNDKNPIWCEFMNEFNASNSRVDTIYNFYKQRPFLESGFTFFGCFRYEYIPEKNAIHIHFYSHRVAGELSKENIKIRKSELHDMFVDIKKKYPQATSVFGFSWLYNVEAYRRLFPAEYLIDPKESTTWFGSLSRWGQFFDGAENLRTEAVESFLECIKHKDSLDELVQCFPYQVLEPCCGIEYFYDLLSVK